MYIRCSESTETWIRAPLDEFSQDLFLVLAGNARKIYKETIMLHDAKQLGGSASRRSFLRKGLVAGGAGAIGAGLLTNGLPVFAAEKTSSLTKGDVAILRFLSAAEIIETDLWQQYNELGGVQDSEVPGGTGNAAYTAALEVLDGDMAQYIHDNTDDEFSHFTFINAYLVAKGADPVNLDKFRTLPSSQADGAQKHLKRLTNLFQLTVDTSWWTKYRSSTANPDFGDAFAQAVPSLSQGQFPAIPRDNNDIGSSTPTNISAHVQAIANTAAFHFGFIEQGGTSLYPSLAQRVTNPEVLRILLSIGPTETAHFQTWHDKAGNAVSQPVAPLTDGALVFPDLNASGGEATQTNLIMPEPTIFLSRKFPKVSIIRPTQTQGAAAGAVKALKADGLFIGQSNEFFEFLDELAEQADAAQRES
jgi:Ferritin-like domain